MTRGPDTIELLDEHFAISIKDKRTSFPAIIKKVYLQEGKVDIQPIHKFKIKETGEKRTPSLIQDVPIVLARSKGSLDLIPIQEGDIGQAIISDRSISEWLNGNGSPIYPKNPNVMEGSQASFIPGGYPFNLSFINALPENARAIIVKSGTGLFLGNDSLLSLNGGNSELTNILFALSAIVTSIDASVNGGANSAKLTELTTALSNLKVTI